MHPKPCRIIACMLLAGLTGPVGVQVAKAAEEKGDYIEVEVRGTLHTGIAAIGGETTGTVIAAKGARLELDLSGNPAWRKLAEKLDGKKAVVAGTLEVRPGVEIRQRWIVTVTSLKPAEARGELRLSVGNDGRLSIGGRQIDEEELAEMLKKTVSENAGETNLVIRADRQVSTGRILEVIRLAQQSGVASFGLVADPEPDGE